MTLPNPPGPDALPPLTRAPLPLASHVSRAFVAIAGGALLITATVFTLGLALLAPIGMIVARSIARRRNSSLTLGKSWLGAASAVAIAFVAILLVVFAQMPKGIITNMQHGADSAAVASAKKPPPAWLERIAPGSAARARAQPTSPQLTQAFTIWSLVVGGVFAYTLFTVVIATAGWVPSLLLSFAFTGRWIPKS